MRKNLIFTWLLFYLLVVSCTPTSGPVKPDQQTPPPDQLSSDIQVANLQAHIDFLADPALKGRKPYSPGGRQAAQYIATKFKNIGLKPGVGQNYLQPFDIKIQKLGPKNSLALNDESLELGRDFLPLNVSANGKLVNSSYPLSVSYGISAPEYKYDDYGRKKDIQKVVVILVGQPSRFKKEQKETKYNYRDLTYKILNAQRHGASGVIIVSREKIDGRFIAANAVWKKFLPDPITKRLNSPEAKLKHLTEQSMTLSRQSRVTPPEEPITIPAVLIVNPAVARKLGSASRVSLQVDITEQTVAHTNNVIGILPGEKQETLVIGAHYDHLGADKDGDIFPGANDNASGIAGILELARVLAKNKHRRTIVFVAFGAEEWGLFGSRYYTNNPLVPVKRTVAMLNMDAIGRPRQSGQMYAIGVKFNPKLYELIKKVNKSVRLTIKDNIDFVFKFGSDHYSFHQKKIPSMDFNTGPFADEHTVGDTADKVQPEMVAAVCQLVLGVARQIADSDIRFPAPKNIEVGFPTGGQHPGSRGGKHPGGKPR
ncbi:MAG: M20/M25/M40 family metallo-hydrolase [Planctomycetes bacterium]|nr:M20/M25/M40 family metallo-hydrolase [Planctomycetota bacterium]